MTVIERVSHLFSIPGVPDRVVSDITGVEISRVRASRAYWKSKTGHHSMHHTGKAAQIHRILGKAKNLTTYETCGELGKSKKPGVCTSAYAEHGEVTSMQRKDGDWMDTTYRAILSKLKYDNIDIDPYSFPCEPLAAGILRIAKPSCKLFLTWGPLQQLRRRPILRSRLLRYLGTETPTKEDKDEFVVQCALREGYKATFIEGIMFDNTLRDVWDLREVKIETRYSKMSDVDGMREAVGVAC